MKGHLYVSTIALLFAISCSSPKDNLSEEKYQNDSLKVIIKKKDSLLGGYLAVFSDIEKTLDSVNFRQNNIYLKIEKTEEIKGMLFSEINAEILSINTLMDKNRFLIEQLNQKLKAADEKNEGLEKSIIFLNTRLSTKQQDLIALDKKLNSLTSDLLKAEFKAMEPLKKSTLEKLYLLSIQKKF